MKYRSKIETRTLDDGTVLYRCKRCGEFLPVDGYYVYKSGPQKGRRQIICKHCYYERNKGYVKKHGGWWHRPAKKGIARDPSGRWRMYIPGGKGNKGGRCAYYWSDSMLEYLTRNFGTTKLADLVIDLGLSRSTIIRKARELGLRKNPAWLRRIQAESARQAGLISRYCGKRQKPLYRDMKQKLS